MFLIRTHHDAQHIANLQHAFMSLRERREDDVPYTIFHLPVCCHPTHRSVVLGAFLNHGSADVVVNRTLAPKLTPLQHCFGLPFLLPTRLLDNGCDAFVTHSADLGGYPKTVMQPHYSEMFERLTEQAYRDGWTRFGVGGQLAIKAQDLVAGMVYQFLDSNMRDAPYGMTVYQTKMSRWYHRRRWDKLFKAV